MQPLSYYLTPLWNASDGGVGSSASSQASDVEIARIALCSKATVRGVGPGAADERVVALAYSDGIQAWRVAKGGVRGASELASLWGVGAVTALAVLPSPDKRRADAFAAARPLLAFATDAGSGSSKATATHAGGFEVSVYSLPLQR